MANPYSLFKKSYYNEITWMKAIATVFITWFHFKWFVPQQFAPLFVGGAIGNSLFFFCSGYLLKFCKEKYFGQWFIRKYLRIMPTVWIAYFVFALCCFLTGTSFLFPNRMEWLYPVRFWFVCNILIYFFICWLLNPVFLKSKLETQKFLIKILLLIIGCVQLIWYILFCNKEIVNIDEGYYKAWYFMIFFLWGYYVKVVEQRIWVTRYSILFAIGSIILFFAYKKLAEHFVLLAYAQVLFVPLLLALVVLSFRMLSAFLLAIKINERTQKYIKYLSNITLEMYVVQVFFIKLIMPKIMFPVNIFASLIIITSVASIVHVGSSLMAKRLKFF